ncbi:MAG: YkgJ family cysteine cluster protein [Nitrospiraceae bacterium]|nr:YkgJ family cysteine cluster protein [Nitrospiraceae bacterium]
MSNRAKFYHKGIRFECQGDGNCCLNHGRHTYVYLSFNDRKRLAVFLGVTVMEFTKNYTHASDGMVHLKDPERDCPFFKDRRCSVHQARPWQCRTWPFWPENMHPKVWERDVASFCPGVGKGRLYTAEEIERIMVKQGEVGGCGVTDTKTGRHGDAE